MASNETQAKMWSWVHHEGIVSISDDAEEDYTIEYPSESIPFYYKPIHRRLIISLNFWLRWFLNIVSEPF